MNDKELYHFLKLGEKSKDHKYIERVNVGSKSKPKYLYFYTQSAYQKYLRNKQRSENRQNNVNINNKKSFSFNNVSSRFNFNKSNAIVNISKPKYAISNTVKKVSNNMSKTVSNVKNTVEKTTKKTAKKANLVVKKASEKAKKTAETIKKESTNKTKDIKTLVSNGKKYIDSLSKKFNSTSSKTLPKISLSGIKKTSTSIIDQIDDMSYNPKIDPVYVEKKPYGYDEIAKKYPKIAEILPKKTKKTSLIEDREIVNPFYNHDDKWQTNCYSCSMAYDMRKRGFDVDAIYDAYNGMQIDEITSCYDGGRFKSLYSASDALNPFKKKPKDKMGVEVGNDLKNELLKESKGEDSYGFVTVWWKTGSAHIFNYEIHDGVVDFIDTQPDYFVNNKVDISLYMKNTKYNSGDIGTMEAAIQYMRTDNLCPNENVLFAVSPEKSYTNYKKPNDDSNAAEYEYQDDFVYLMDRIIDFGEKNHMDPDQSFEIFGKKVTINDAKKGKESAYKHLKELEPKPMVELKPVVVEPKKDDVIEDIIEVVKLPIELIVAGSEWVAKNILIPTAEATMETIDNIGEWIEDGIDAISDIVEDVAYKVENTIDDMNIAISDLVYDAKDLIDDGKDFIKKRFD